MEQVFTASDLQTHVLKYTDRRVNSDSSTFDQAYDSAVLGLLKRTANKLSKIPSQTEAVKFAEDSLENVIAEITKYGSEAGPRKAGTNAGRFEAWKSIIEFLGGMVPKEYDVSFFDDLPGYY